MLFVKLVKGGHKWSQDNVVDYVNKYGLTREGCGGSREKHIVVERKIRRLVANKQIGVIPVKKRKKAITSRHFLKLAALHWSRLETTAKY